MKKKARKGKPKAKGNGKHDDPVTSSPDLAQGIIPSTDLTSPAFSSSSAQPTPSNDMAASPTCTKSPLPEHETSPRGCDCDEINQHNTLPVPGGYQATSRPLYADVVRGNKPQGGLRRPVQFEEIHDNSFEDNGESSPYDSSEDHDDFSFDYSEDYDEFATTRSKPISDAMVNEHNTPPCHPTYLDAVRKGKQPTQKQALQILMQPKEITSAADNVEHRSTPPPDPRPSYAGVLMANVAGASSISGVLIPQQVFRPLVESLEILDYSFEDHGSFIPIKLDAAQLIPVGANFEKEEVPKIKEICEPHVGYLKSIQNLSGLLKKHRLVRRVEIFRGKMTILLATAQGRLFAQAMVAVIWECHSQKRSWNGTFDFDNIRIVEPCKSKEFMMILKDPVEFEGKALLQAKANDLHKAAAILESLYKAGDDFPVYFEEFIENLQQPIRELVANERAFKEYLSYHPAIMPSTSRSTFVNKLSNIGTRGVMLSKPPAYLYDWRTIVKSEINGKIKAKDINNRKEKKDTDIISVLYTVFHHKNNYDDKVGGLIRFMRNVVEHGKEHDDRVIHGYELELYLAKMFSGFPSTLRTMLMLGTMEELYGEDWSSYKMSKRNKWEPAWSD